MQRTISGRRSLNAIPRSYLLHRVYYAGRLIPTESNYFRYAGSFTDTIMKDPYSQLNKVKISAMKGPNLFEAKEGYIR